LTRLLCACLLLAALSGCGEPPAPTATLQDEIQAAVKTVAGIPQDGITLGALDAPATLTVYASLDDLNLGFLRNDLPRIIEQWVRPGRLRIQLRTTSQVLLGAPSDRGAVVAAGLAHAVGLQDRLWQFYLALSTRYVGSIDDALLDQALSDVRVDPARIRKEAESARIRDAIARGEEYAREAKVSMLPSYVLETPGRALRRVNGSCFGCLEKDLARNLTR